MHQAGGRPCAYCGLVAASCFAIGAQRAVSASTNLVNSAGDINRDSMASSASRFCTSGNCMALRVSRLVFSTMSLGNRAGPDSENQVAATNPAQ